VLTLDDPGAAMNRTQLAANDLVPGALKHLAQAERQSADARDLLGRSQAEE